MESERKKNDWLVRTSTWLRKRYRLVIINDVSLDERYSIRLTKVGVFVFFGLLSLVLIGSTIFLISVTRLKEYIPGYSSDFATKRNLVLLAERVDSLEQVEKQKDLLLLNIQNIINNKPVEKDLTSAKSSKTEVDQSKLLPTEKERNLRAEVEKNERYNLSKAGSGSIGFVSYFYPPVKGKLSTAFNPGIGHYGVDIVSAKDEAVKATLDGVVIFSGWTSDMGHVIQIQHANNVVSIYKHNAAILKKDGQKVKAGEVIAIVGNSGELSSNPHLHFEVWMDGQAIDPQTLMVF